MSPVESSPARPLFGTDGVRGLANVEPVTVETAVRLGRAVAEVCRTALPGRPRLVVGKDTRWSGDMLESALAAGICSRGFDVLLAGPIPTPAIAFLTRSLNACAGVVVSASHNPFQDNGIKFFASDGFKLPDHVEVEIERRLCDASSDAGCPTGRDIGRISRVEDAAERYSEFVRHSVPGDLSLVGLTIAVDCAHGAAYLLGPALLQALGARVVAIGVQPDGVNINDRCGATHPERLQALVTAEQAQLGIAWDGDADRAMFVDETGVVVDGDQVLAMVADDMLRRGTLKQSTVVATVMSNLGLEVALRERGARLVRVQVGDRNVVEEMRRHDYNLGGEQSGHVVFLDHSTTGDGLITALGVVRLLVERQQPLSALTRVMTRFPQVLLNVPVARCAEWARLPRARQTIDRIAATLGERGRVVVRFSGTEPLVRVMVQGESLVHVQALAEEVAGTIRSELTP